MKKENSGYTAYNVYLNGKKIETVFWSFQSYPDEVRRSLINHDGYDSGIIVKKEKKRKN